MPDPIFDPTLPADHAPLSSAQMRGQFQAILNRFEAHEAYFFNYGHISPLGLTVSDPPTRAEMQAIADKLDEVIINLQL
jgi:hypothetical protein